MLWLPGSVLSLPAMLIAGGAASPHCAAMCGALGAHHARAASAELPTALTRIYGGRVAGYGLLGGLAGGFGQALLRVLPDAASGRVVQALAALVLVFIGARLLLTAPSAPACCLPRRGGDTERPRWPLFVRGLSWAAVPCGLLYSVLLLCAVSGSPWQGAALAAVFAIGSTPMLALIGWHSARQRDPQRHRRQAGGWLLALGVLGLAAVLCLPAIGGSAWCAAAGKAIF